MPYFADTSFFLALKNKTDNFHHKAEEIVTEILHGRMDRPYSSDYILDEAITIVRNELKNHKTAVEIGKMILRSKYINMIKVEKNIIEKAFESYEKYQDKDLSFTDWTSYHLIKQKGLTGIISTDHHFEQVGIQMLK